MNKFLSIDSIEYSQLHQIKRDKALILRIINAFKQIPYNRHFTEEKTGDGKKIKLEMINQEILSHQ